MEGSMGIIFDSVITNGYVDIETMQHFLRDGWTFVCTIPAKQVHPHACDTDKFTLFSKYIEPVIDSEDCKCAENSK
jgi:hypothetical protein